MFHFLWARKAEKDKIQLVGSESLSMPETLGGWGLKSLFWFEREWTSKILWGVVERNGLWSSLVKESI